MLKDLLVKASDSVEVADGSSVGDMLTEYARGFPQLKEALPSLAVAVNQHYAVPETVLKQGDEVALLPPVSGGLR